MLIWFLHNLFLLNQGHFFKVGVMINRFNYVGHFHFLSSFLKIFSEVISKIDSEIKSAVIGAPSKHNIEMNFCGLTLSFRDQQSFHLSISILFYKKNRFMLVYKSHIQLQMEKTLFSLHQLENLQLIIDQGILALLLLCYQNKLIHLS